MSYLTAADYDRFYTLPITLPETELRSRCYIQVCTFVVTEGMVLEMPSLTVQVLRILTPGVSPVLADTSLGLVSAGLLASSMLSGAVGLVTQNAVGASSWNGAQPVVITAPGVYRVVVLNNSTNVDVAVVVTGAVCLRDVGVPARAGVLFMPITSVSVQADPGAFAALVPSSPLNV